MGDEQSTAVTPDDGLRARRRGVPTGLERNADVIMMNCYAPLLVNVNPGGRQWAVDLIGYDALKSFGSPSYFVQEMFSNNRGDVVLPAKLDPLPKLTPEQIPVAPQPNRHLEPPWRRTGARTGDGNVRWRVRQRYARKFQRRCHP